MKDIVRFLFEVGTLKNMPRTGWQLLGIEKNDYIAAHSHRASAIAYFIAKSEGLDIGRTVIMSVFHDVHESRIGDIHKVARRYIEKDEKMVHEEQLKNLDDELLSLIYEYENLSTPEADAARDADLLEAAFTAKEMIKIGYRDAQNWIDNVRKILKTETAKKMLIEMEKTDPSEWWKNLKKIYR